MGNLLLGCVMKAGIKPAIMRAYCTALVSSSGIMELFSFDFDGSRFAVVLDLDLQLERLLIDGVVQSVQPLGAAGNHRFVHGRLGEGQLLFEVRPVEQWADYHLYVDGQEVDRALAELSDDAKSRLNLAQSQTGVARPAPDKGHNWLALAGIGIKLFKTVKVVKVALVAASVAVYSMLFSVEFALALVAVLVFHEYGHLRAMKKFGIPTKGMYLIPFLGGLAVGDKPRTQWENLYISMMGPVFGLLMTVVFYVIYLVTGSHFCGLVTSVSALLNLFNMIPVYPLDGGHAVKSLVFSRRNYLALLSFLTISAICFVLSWKFGLVFLSFFIVLGVLDIIAGWKVPLDQDMTPLKTYGIWFSLLWYLAVTGAFLVLILLIAKAGVPGSEIAMKVLQS
jgi:putative peptide zinc metalloprotease protein